MSEEIDHDLFKEAGDKSGERSSTGEGRTRTVEAPDSTVAETAEPERSGGRLIGLLALLLGIVGSLLMVILAALSIRFGFSASSTTDQAMEPVRASFDRLDTRIDQTDDLVIRDGIDPQRLDELRARVDGLVDVSSGTYQGFRAIGNHPIYRLLPADLSSLDDSLAGFESSSSRIDSLLAGSSGRESLTPNAIRGVADELDAMQGRVSGTREMINDAQDSLRRWIRFGSFLGFLGSLWGLWAQTALAGRGWRRIRGRVI